MSRSQSGRLGEPGPAHERALMLLTAAVVTASVVALAGAGLEDRPTFLQRVKRQSASQAEFEEGFESGSTH